MLFICAFRTINVRLFFLILLLFFFLMPSLGLSAADVSAATGLSEGLSIQWVVIAAALVFFMQAGFLLLETGLVRSKNSINVAIKNLVDYLVGGTGFFLAGFGIMFGLSSGGFIGTNHFLLHGIVSPEALTFFLYQVTFMGTAATIVSGAVAERIRFQAYIIISLLISVLIYPVFGHWAWGGGWLSSMGFHDFAGSTVVHSVGGWVALAGVIVTGPRMYRFDENGKPKKLTGHNLPIAVLGALILWFGWYGFNGGSTLTFTDSVPLILVNTSISAIGGGMSGMAVSWIFNRHPDVEDLINGTLGGLVAVTAGCDVFTPTGSLLIGSVAGLLVFFVTYIMVNFFRLDDVVGAFPVHAACGIWGTLAVSIFATNPELTGFAQFLVQLTGVAVCAAWSFGIGLLLFWGIRLTIGVRVTAESETQGLNVSEHGAKTNWHDLMVAMQHIADHKDLTSRLTVERETEAGHIAERFNELLNKFSEIIITVKAETNQVDAASHDLNQSSTFIAEEVGKFKKGIDSVDASLEQIARAVDQVKDMSHIQTTESAGISEFFKDLTVTFEDIENQLSDIGQKALSMRDTARSGGEQMLEADNSMKQMVAASQRVQKIVETLADISDRLNLLSLNASIEAARSGQAGSGFAVVAGEMNRLAESTASNAKEAGDELKTLHRVVQTTELNLNASRTAFEDLKGGVESVAEQINHLHAQSESYRQRISKAGSQLNSLANMADTVAVNMNEKFKEVKLIGASLHELSETFGELTAQAEELQATSDLLNERSLQLKEIIAVFKVNDAGPYLEIRPSPA